MLLLFVMVLVFIYGYFKPYKSHLINYLEVSVLVMFLLLLVLRANHFLQDMLENTMKANETSVPSCSGEMHDAVTTFALVLSVVYYLPAAVGLICLFLWIGSITKWELSLTTTHEMLCVSINLPIDSVWCMYRACYDVETVLGYYNYIVLMLILHINLLLYFIMHANYYAHFHFRNLGFKLRLKLRSLMSGIAESHNEMDDFDDDRDDVTQRLTQAMSVRTTELEFTLL